MVLALPRLLVLSKNQQNSILIFLSFWKRNDWQSASER